MDARRVIVWGTGTIGAPALRAVIDHPDLELVGVHAWSPDKVGRDAGDLVGLPATGVVVTADLDTLVNLDADCVAYFANLWGEERKVIDQMARFLERGTNVVTTSIHEFVHPTLAPDDLRLPAAAACQRGQSSLFCGGVDPGYCTSGLALAALTIGGRVDQVRLQELGDMGAYEGWHMREIFGFGESLDFVSPLVANGVIQAWWGPTVIRVAGALGIDIDNVELVYEKAALDFDFDVACGTISAGTVAAVHFELRGMSNGSPAVVLEHVDRVHPDAGPEWAAPFGPEVVSYRVTVTGDPTYTCEVNFSMDDGCAATALHAINAIPAVCAGPPGLVDPFTLPPFHSTNVSRAR